MSTRFRALREHLTGLRQVTTSRMRTFVLVIAVMGAVVLTDACLVLAQESLPLTMLLLGIATVASGRFRIKVPGHPATVSVSEVFVFSAVLLFGPAAATVIVAIDGLWISLGQANRRPYRTIFNVAEPAVTTAFAGYAFVAALANPPFGLPETGPAALLLPTVVLAAVYFALNSALTSIAVALESGGSAWKLWRSHAPYLAMNYYAAASLATLIVKGESAVSLGVLGLVGPLLILSYAAYKNAASRVEDADRHLREVEHLYHATVETLAIAVDAKDQVTHGHIRRVQRHTVTVARALGIEEPIQIRALAAASLLHDVGKLAVPDYVLNKPGSLSPSEFERIKLHAAKGAEILSAVKFPYAVVPIVRHHHEQWSGHGYPDGLAGEDIPFGARILAVVDCFDAVTSDRPYRRKMSDAEGIAILEARAGTMYDPRVVEAFVTLVPELRRGDAAADGNPLTVLPVDTTPTPSATFAAALPTLADRDGIRVHLSTLLSAHLATSLPAAQACLFSPTTSDSMLSVAYATPGIRESVSSLRIPVGEGLAGWVAVNRHTIINSQADLDLGAAAAPLALKTCTATPVFALGELVGVLSVYLPHPGTFSERDVRDVSMIAQEVGLAMARRAHVASGQRQPSAGRRAS